MAKKTLLDVNTNELSFETKQIHIGQELPDPASDARAVPIYQTTSYVFKDAAHAAARFNLSDAGNIYGRLTNSTQGVLESRIAALESGTAALAVASGAAAVTYSILNIAQPGDEIVASNKIYGGTINLLQHTLPIYGIKTVFVNPDEDGSFANAITPKTKAIFTETLGNPSSNAADIEGLAKLAHDNGIIFIVDNTFASPYLLRPLELGADIIIESATKFIGGHGTALGGLIIEGGKFDYKASGKYPLIVNPSPSYHGASFWELLGAAGAAFVTRIRAVLLRDTGSSIAPLTAFLLLQGLETLSLRIERHVENTIKVLEYLKKQPKVLAIHHPSFESEPSNALYKKYFPNGGASIFTFEIKGGQEEAHKFIDNLALFSLLANVADVKSLVIHPATTTHSQSTAKELLEQGIEPNTVRLSIGTENIKDIIADLERAFKAV